MVSISKTCEIVCSKIIEINYNLSQYSKREEPHATIIERKENFFGSYFLSKEFLSSVKITKSDEIRFRLKNPSGETWLLASGFKIGQRRLLALSCYLPLSFPEINNQKDAAKELIIAVSHQTCNHI